MIRKALKEHIERRLERLIDGRRKSVVPALFEESYDWAKKNIYTHVFDGTEQAAVKAFLFKGANELFDDKL